MMKTNVYICAQNTEKVCNMDVKEKKCNWSLSSAWHLVAPFFRAIYAHELSHCGGGQPSTPILSPALSKQTWLSEKHSVHISGCPSLEIRLNKKV